MVPELMRTAWIAPVLEPGQRRELTQHLDRILPGESDQRSLFIDAAEECVDIYRKLGKAASAERAEQEHKLQRLLETATWFANAVSALGPDTRFLLYQHQWSVLGPRAEIPDAHQRTAEAAEWARIIARAADRQLNNIRKRRRPGPKGDAAFGALISDIASAYDQVFGEQPSAAREGTFAKALKKILEACGVRDPRGASEALEIGETRLRSILKNQSFTGRAPKPGKKARLSK
jgi:hypothetical protein